ncbi:hypothetical protein [Saccharothrix deserti]|uniref:hypothetical protein n=1 Tax=Saccharothrix deserti TaxID=2593674 RepID=UPI00131D9F85|nr:hypothetical protein [Saccharothrix deserti]
MERRRPGPDAEEIDEPRPAVPSPASAAGRAEGLRTGLAMVGVFLVAEVVLLLAAALVLVPFAVADPGLLEGDRLPPWPLLTLLVVPTVLAALTAVAGTALWGGGSRAGRVRRELALRWSWNDVGTGLAFGRDDPDGAELLPPPRDRRGATAGGPERGAPQRCGQA